MLWTYKPDPKGDKLSWYVQRRRGRDSDMGGNDVRLKGRRGEGGEVKREERKGKEGEDRCEGREER